jgi:hypothetical protein
MYKNKRCHNPEGHNVNTHHRENLKIHIVLESPRTNTQQRFASVCLQYEMQYDKHENK